ncbi:MAG: PAS domain S-box protein [Kofleriaceae bacterium]|nr:PAS domain S-box protein [Kofleriaceae bacterium]
MLAEQAVADTVFGLLFESGAEAAFVVNRSSQALVSCNQRLREMLGYPDDAGCPRGVVFAPDDGGRGDREILEHAGTYEDVALIRSDGYPLYVQLTVAHVHHAELGPLAACLARDTTERRNLERELVLKHSALIAAHAELERVVNQLREAQVQLEQQHREISLLAGEVSRFGWRAAVGELCAGIAHHLNNPVGAMISTLRTLNLRVAELAPEQRIELEPLIKRARDVAVRIETNVNAVVRTHKAGSIDNQPRPLDLAGELDTALTLLAGRLSGVAVVRAYRGPIPCVLPQEPLHHVLGHLVDNAVQAMAGAGTLRLEVVVEPTLLRLSVADSGTGIDDEMRSRLFDPILSARPGHAGLGLSTAQRLARLWGGDVVFAGNRPGAGACFDVIIPVAAPAIAPGAAAPPSPGKETP